MADVLRFEIPMKVGPKKLAAITRLDGQDT
jgi:hypothetical protein